MQTALFWASWLALLAVLVAWHLDQRRHDAQVRAILDRVSTEPRIELRPAYHPPTPDTMVRKYIGDHEADDAAWNEYRGEPQEDTE
jgi:hypothetical protein